MAHPTPEDIRTYGMAIWSLMLPGWLYQPDPQSDTAYLWMEAWDEYADPPPVVQPISAKEFWRSPSSFARDQDTALSRLPSGYLASYPQQLEESLANLLPQGRQILVQAKSVGRYSVEVLVAITQPGEPSPPIRFGITQAQHQIYQDDDQPVWAICRTARPADGNWTAQQADLDAVEIASRYIQSRVNSCH